MSNATATRPPDAGTRPLQRPASAEIGVGRLDETIDLPIDGMSCASCARRVEAALRLVPGVTEASVNLATERATVRRDAALTGIADLVAAVQGAGYDAVVPPAGMLAPEPANDHAASAEASDVPETLTAHAHGAGKAEMRDAALLRLRRDVIVAATLTAPVFLVEMGAHLIPAFHHWLAATLGTWSWFGQFVLATLVLFGPGLRFFRKGIPALLRGAPDMNSLVVLGAGAA